MTHSPTFEQQLLSSIGTALGLTYEQLSADYAAVKTADDLAWEEEKRRAEAAYQADIDALRARMLNAWRRLQGEWWLDAIGLPRGMQP